MLIPLAITLAYGQVNGENLAAAAHDEGFGVQLNLGGALARGNVDLLDLQGGLGVQYRKNLPADKAPDNGVPWLRDRFILRASGRYLGVGGTPSIDNRLVTARYTRALVPRVHLELATQYQNNLLLLLRSRWTTNVGAGFVLVQTADHALHMGGGMLIEHEVRAVDPEGPDDPIVVNPRLIAATSWRVGIVPKRLSWTHQLYVEPRVDDFGDVLTVDYNTLSAHVSKVMSLTTELQVRHDSRPPAGLKPLDITWTWGLQFRWAAQPDDNPAH